MLEREYQYMIFETDQREFESEKERNLYYKFFAGFYFNELISGYENRVREFYALLRSPTYQVGDPPINRLQSVPSAVFVSFDNHPDRYRGKQSGEFADILIHDPLNDLLVGIEAKYLDNWEYRKDIVENTEKLEYMGAKLGVTFTQLCLLVSRSKWDRVVAMEAHHGSNFRRLKEHTGAVSVLLWESLMGLQAVPQAVRSYVQSQLDHPRLRTLG